MIKNIQNLHPAVFVLIATILEAAGDAIVRKCLYEYSGSMRIAFFILGAFLLFGYGLFLNLAPIEFGQVVGLYIVLLFIMFQITNYIAFHTVPALPVIVGGLLIISGGLIIAFWKE